jgi:trk system potassium uptake protein
MNIVILGAGKIGSYLASILSKEEHNVIIIDKDSKQLEKVGRETDVGTLFGYGSKWKLLDDLIENEPSLFIAMTGDDETNLVACSIAKNLGYPKTVARVKDISFLARSRLDFGKLFYIDYFIGAEVLAAYDLLKSILNAGDLAIENFAHGAVQMRTFNVPDSWNKEDIAIKSLDLPENLIISLIRRNVDKKDIIIFPHGHDYIKKGDEITIVGETKAMYNLHSFFKTQKNLTTSIVLIGGNSVAYQLALIADKFDIEVKIIEKDEDRCNTLADLLPNATIINHDGTDVYFLASEQIQNADAVIASTSNDDTNLLISLLGKQVGCKKVIALISDITLGPILRELDITFSISERVNIANKILSIIHKETIISIASLCDNRAKVVELKVSPDSQLVGIPLADLSTRLPKDLLIAAIENRGRVMIGSGSRVFSPNDTIILISSPEHIHELEDLF